MMSSRFDFSSTSKTLNLSFLRFNERFGSKNLDGMMDGTLSCEGSIRPRFSSRLFPSHQKPRSKGVKLTSRWRRPNGGVVQSYGWLGSVRHCMGLSCLTFVALG